MQMLGGVVSNDRRDEGKLEVSRLKNIYVDWGAEYNNAHSLYNTI